MKRPRPVRIVTLPGRTVPELREQARRAGAAGADMAEVRVDRLTPYPSTELASLFPSSLPLLGTYRSQAEGGEGADDTSERRRTFDELGQLGFAALDREGRRDLPPGPGQRAIVSYHLPQLPAPTELRRLLATAEPASWFVKVVVPASLAELATVVLPALPAPEENSYVLHTTGASGPLLRAWAGRLGMAAVYCALPEGPATERPVEASQLPVSRVVRFQEGPQPGGLFAILGHPVSESASPRIHSAWFELGRRAGLYLALDVASESEFEVTLRTLADGDFAGVNVTRPWKTAARALSDESAPSAESTGCANTLTFRGGEIRAENTDLFAVHRRLTELKGSGHWDGERLTVIGAGGAARASLAAARALGCSATVLARRDAEADRLAREFGEEAGRWEVPRPTGLLVNATPVGGPEGGTLPAALPDWIPRGGYVLDFVYAPHSPILAQAAAARDASYEDGWRLLVYQAAESHGIWWGRSVPPDWVARLVAEGPCTA